MGRLWLLPQGPAGRESVILTGGQIAAADLHPLRLVYLGRFPSADSPEALAAARAAVREPTLVIAANVRAACDRGLTRRFRLSEQEISLLRGGEIIRVRDRAGEFSIRYSRIGPVG